MHIGYDFTKKDVKEFIEYIKSKEFEAEIINYDKDKRIQSDIKISW